jgi:hypothetical protein
VAGAVTLALGVGACGLAKRINHPTSADAANVYVDAGPVTYQVQISRALNPFSTEDAQYLAGIPKAQTIPANQLWFAVFVWRRPPTSSRSSIRRAPFITRGRLTLRSTLTLGRRSD